MTDPLERLTNLVALLLETRVPLTLNEIADELRGQYPAGDSARRAAFEREKAQLRALGIPLTTEVLSGERAGQTAYRIQRERFELGDFGLTDDERAALQLAVATVRLGAGWADDALIKLGAGSGDGAGGLFASLLAPTTLPALFDAVSRRCVVRFGYRDKERELEPWGLLARTGFWYLVGHDRGAGSRRTYRVDRIEGSIRVGAEGAFVRPEGFDARSALPEDIKALGEQDEPQHAAVLVDAPRARAAVLEVGERAVRERRDGGAVVLDVACSNRPAFRSWLLGFVEHAEVLGPPEVRAEIEAWLASVVERG